MHASGGVSYNFFVVGERRYDIPVVGHYDGSSMGFHEPQAFVWIRDIWGTGTDTLYLAGGEGTLVHVMKN
ncbi:MAG: hypothetical protein GY838_01415 [bacterium]|nr:hypothetical protein [bacterium]